MIKSLSTQHGFMKRKTTASWARKQDTALDERITRAIGAVAEKKASDVTLLRISKIASFADYFLICSGGSNRQVQAIAAEVQEKLAEVGVKPLHIEGARVGEWVLVDYGDFIVHVFSETSRRFYDLERLWRDAERVELSKVS